jgi:hypothetical protein
MQRPGTQFYYGWYGDVASCRVPFYGFWRFS